MNDTRLGNYFTLSEFTRSTAAASMGHPNQPPAQVVTALLELVVTVLDPLRAEEGPVRITSGYRAPDVNRAVGGSSTSQHVSGEAADIKLVHDHDAERVAALIHAMELPVDQCIWYTAEVGGHVHVSHRKDGRQRGQFLKCYRENGEKRYATYFPSRHSVS